MTDANLPRFAASERAAHHQKNSLLELIQNVCANYGFYFSGYFLSFLLMPFLVRVLGPAEWGIFALTQTFGAYVILVQECGFSFSATRIVARNRTSPEVLSEVVAGVWGAKLALLLINIGFGAIALLLVPAFRSHALLFVCGVVWGILQGANLNWFYQGMERIRAAAIVDLSVKAIAVAVTFYVVHGPQDAWKVMALTAAACAISLLTLSALVYRTVPFRAPETRLTLRALRGGIAGVLPRNAFLLSSASGVFILGLLVAPGEVGQYTGAERISRAIIGLLLPITDALYSRLNRVVALAPASFFQVASVLFCVMVGLGVSISIGLVAAAPAIVKVVLGDGFDAAVGILRIFGVMGVFVALSNTLGIHWMLALGLDSALTRISLCSVLFTIGGCCFLAPRFGGTGVAWTVVVSQVFMTLACLFVLRSKRAFDNQLAMMQPAMSLRTERCVETDLAS